MLANLDYTVVGADDVQILECKTAGEFGSRLWRDGVPEYVQCQVHHQLAVTGKTTADVCVLVCGQEISIRRIERDDALIARLIELERKFWSYVESDTPPPADGSDSAAMALQCLYPICTAINAIAFQSSHSAAWAKGSEAESTIRTMRPVRHQVTAYTGQCGQFHHTQKIPNRGKQDIGLTPPQLLPWFHTCTDRQAATTAQTQETRKCIKRIWIGQSPVSCKE